MKLIQIEEEEHINKIKILSQSYEVEIKIEEAKLEWLRQDWGMGKKTDGPNDDIMKNLMKQLEEAEKAKMEAEDLKQQAWERAKVMVQDGFNERRKVDQLADETENFLRRLDKIQNDNGYMLFNMPSANTSSSVPPEFERLCQ